MGRATQVIGIHWVGDTISVHDIKNLQIFHIIYKYSFLSIQ